MKGQGTGLKKALCLGLLLCLVLLPFASVQVRAEETGDEGGEGAEEEAVAEISDGYDTQRISLKSYGGNVTQTVYVHPKTKQVKISVIKGKWDGESVSYSYEPKLAMAGDILYTPVDRVSEKQVWGDAWGSTSGSDDSADTQVQKVFSGSTLLCIKRLQKPKVSLSVSAGAKSGYVPNDKNKVHIQVRVQSELDHKVTLHVYDASGKEVFQWNSAASGQRVYAVSWNAKPSKGNKAKLPTSSFLPKGTYKIVAEASLESNGRQLTAKKEKKLKVVPNGTVPIYGNDQKNMVPILTGDLETDYLAEVILSKIIQDNMTNEQKIKAVYTWMVKNVKHRDDYWDEKKYPVVYEKDMLSLTARTYLEKCRQDIAEGKAVYGSDSLFAQGASDVFKRRVGVCSGISLAEQVLLNHLGFNSGVTHGMYKNRNGSTPDHYWNYVWLNGKSYWLDVDVELSNWRGGAVSYYWYLKGDKEWKTNHIWNE